MNNWIGPTAKQLWNYVMHVLHESFGFNINKTTFCLGQSSLHLLLLKSSMVQHISMRKKERNDLCFLSLELQWGGRSRLRNYSTCYANFDRFLLYQTLQVKIWKETKTDDVVVADVATVRQENVVSKDTCSLVMALSHMHENFRSKLWRFS